MKKKTIAILVAALAALGFTSCKKEKSNESMLSKYMGTWVTAGTSFFLEGAFTASVNPDTMSPLYWLEPLVIDGTNIYEYGREAIPFRLSGNKMIIDDTSMKSRELSINEYDHLTEYIVRNDVGQVNIFGSTVSFDELSRDYYRISPISDAIGKKYLSTSVNYYDKNDYIVGKQLEFELEISNETFTFAGVKQPIQYTSNCGILKAGANEPFVKIEAYLLEKEKVINMICCMQGSTFVKLSNGEERNFTHMAISFSPVESPM